MPAEPLQKVCTKNNTGGFGTGDETLLRTMAQYIDFSLNSPVGAVNRGREKAEKRRRNTPKRGANANSHPRNMAGIPGFFGEIWGGEKVCL